MSEPPTERMTPTKHSMYHNKGPTIPQFWNNPPVALHSCTDDLNDLSTTGPGRALDALHRVTVFHKFYEHIEWHLFKLDRAGWL